MLPFTKTYRILEHENHGFKLKNSVQKIKFYGHSLSEADYSYFQTIFDSVDLYDGETKLYFYYNIYDLDKKFIIVETVKQSVYRLVRCYGVTLNNKEHGKNMLHKLIIEGRIKVVELDTSFIETKK